MPTAPAGQASIGESRKTCEAPSPLQLRFCKRKGGGVGLGVVLPPISINVALRFFRQRVSPHPQSSVWSNAAILGKVGLAGGPISGLNHS